jgi:hypothetical protein
MALKAPFRSTNFPAQGIWRLKNIRDEAAAEVGLWPRNAPPDTIVLTAGSTTDISRADTTSAWKYYALPAGKIITIHCAGGGGAGGGCWNYGGGSGSNGGKASATFTAVGDEVIMICVGGFGGINGGNSGNAYSQAGQGGGATACQNFFTDATIVVAAGGSGGSSGWNNNPGYGGNGGVVSTYAAGPQYATGASSSTSSAVQ